MKFITFLLIGVRHVGLYTLSAFVLIRFPTVHSFIRRRNIKKWTNIKLFDRFSYECSYGDGKNVKNWLQNGNVVKMFMLYTWVWQPMSCWCIFFILFAANFFALSFFLFVWIDDARHVYTNTFLLLTLSSVYMDCYFLALTTVTTMGYHLLSLHRHNMSKRIQIASIINFITALFSARLFKTQVTGYK